MIPQGIDVKNQWFPEHDLHSWWLFHIYVNVYKLSRPPFFPNGEMVSQDDEIHRTCGIWNWMLWKAVVWRWLCITHVCMHINCLRHFLLLSLFVVMISNIFPDSWIRYLIRYPLGTHQVGNLPICRRPALQCCISCLKEGPVIGLAWQSLSSTCCGSIGVSL